MNAFLDTIATQGSWAIIQIGIALVLTISVLGIVVGLAQAIWIMVARLFGREMNVSSQTSVKTG